MSETQTESKPMFWRVHWDDRSEESVAWFQSSRGSGSAPDGGQEVVNAEAYDALSSLLNEALEAIEGAASDISYGLKSPEEHETLCSMLLEKASAIRSQKLTPMTTPSSIEGDAG